jgi:hypothetical protein
MGIVSFTRAFFPAGEEARFLLLLLSLLFSSTRILRDAVVVVAVGRCYCGVVLGLFAFVHLVDSAGGGWC